nr:hypothetical protein FAC5L9_06 [Penicillium camemberti]
MSKTNIESLPLEILLGVTANLSMKEYCALLGTNKSLFNSLINDMIPHAIKTKCWMRALRHGVKLNNEVAVRRILDWKQLKKAEEDISVMNSILSAAIVSENQPMVEILLSYSVSANPVRDEDLCWLWTREGLNVNRRLEWDKLYPLHWAAELGADLSFVEALISEGANVFKGVPSACRHARNLGEKRIAALLSKEMDERGRISREEMDRFWNSPSTIAILAPGRVGSAPRADP